MNSRVAYIYALCEPDTGEIRYVGKTEKPQKRFKAHLEPGNLKNNTPKNTWLKSLLSSGEMPRMQILEVVPADGWQEAEKWWIRLLRGQGVELKNCDDGGLGGENRQVKPETRAKLSAFHTGKAWNLGRKFSDEWIENLARSHRAYYDKLKDQGVEISKTPETCRKIALARQALPDEAIREIRGLAQTTGVPYKEIGARHGLNSSEVGRIVRGERYKWVLTEAGEQYVPSASLPRRNRGPLPEERVRQIKSLLAKGHSRTSVARMVGVSYFVVVNIAKQLSYTWVECNEN